MNNDNAAFRPNLPRSGFIKYVVAGTAQGSWNMKKNSFNFQLPPGTTEACMTFKGTAGIYEFDFTTFECYGLYVAWGDADFDFHSSEYLLECEFQRSKCRHPSMTSYPFPRHRAHKISYNPTRPRSVHVPGHRTPRSSPSPRHSLCSDSASTTGYHASRSRSHSRSPSLSPTWALVRLSLLKTICSFLDELCDTITNHSDLHDLAISSGISTSKVYKAITDNPGSIENCVHQVIFIWLGSSNAPASIKINTLQNGFENRPAVFRRLLAKHRTVSQLANASRSHSHSPSRPGTSPLTAARVVGAASPSRSSPIIPEQGMNNLNFHSPPSPTTSETPILLQYDSESYNTLSNTPGGNGEGVNENSEDPQEPQIIRFAGDTGGKVRFTIPGDGISETPQNLKEKLHPQVVLKRVDIKRVESIE